jgi:hypothetical protein
MAPVFEKCNVPLLSQVPVGLALCVTWISPMSVPVRASALDQPQFSDQGFTPLPLASVFLRGGADLPKVGQPATEPGSVQRGPPNGDAELAFRRSGLRTGLVPGLLCLPPRISTARVSDLHWVPE